MLGGGVVAAKKAGTLPPQDQQVLRSLRVCWQVTPAGQQAPGHAVLLQLSKSAQLATELLMLPPHW
jgi:hypothetical protein